MLLEPGEPDEVKIVRHPLLDVRSGRARHCEPERGIVVNGLPWKQAEMLENHGHTFRRAGNGTAGNQKPALADVGKTRDAAQQGRLPAAARADDAEDLLLPDGQIELPKRHDRAVQKKLACILGDDGECGVFRLHATCGSSGRETRAFLRGR